MNEKTFAILLRRLTYTRSPGFFLRLASRKILIGFTVEDAEHFIDVMKSTGVTLSKHEKA